MGWVRSCVRSSTVSKSCNTHDIQHHRIFTPPVFGVEQVQPAVGFSQFFEVESFLTKHELFLQKHDVSTVKLLLVNTPPVWSTCFSEQAQERPREFWWIWTSPAWSPLRSECERIFQSPMYTITFTMWTSIEGTPWTKWWLLMRENVE